jgi:rhodanese-related sulfurtransferase
MADRHGPFKFELVGGVPEVTCDEVFAHLELVEAGRLRLIDVRRPDEFNNELGHVDGAELITLGPELSEFLEKQSRDQQIVFICRSGVRSAGATTESQRMGYQFTFNMSGGMLEWNKRHLPAVRSEDEST